MNKVLVMEDEGNIRSFMAISLQRAGYEVLEAENGKEALNKIQQDPQIAVALLDVTVPGMDGFEVCRRLRGRGKNLGLILMTAHAQETEKVTNSVTGADDYLAKPFSPAELTARVDAMFRRMGNASQTEGELLSHGPFVMNVHNHTLDKKGERIRLTQAEYSIMKLFLSKPGRNLTREEIMTAAWGDKEQTDPKILEANIRRLRIKIEDDSANPKYINTVWGVGYRWGL